MINYAQRGNDRLTCRRGTVLPFVAFAIVALVAFLALAIDLGMLAIAKTQAQNAADLAALTAMRTVNGDSSTTYNTSNATTNAQNVLTYNYVLGQKLQTSQLTLTYGSYDYNSTTQTFSANFPPTSGVPYTAAQATVTFGSLPTAFSSVLGSSVLPSVTAVAQAVHRPRDIGLVMDLSSSMRYGTLLGFDLTTTSRATNNPDTAIPTFGHYSSSSAVLTGTSSNRTSAYDNYTISPSNTTATNTSYSLTYINGFYQNAAYATTLIRAFDSYSSTDNGKTWTAPSSQRPQLPASGAYTATPNGDAPLFLSGSTSVYAQNVNDVIGVSPNTGTSTAANTLWELDGYSAYSAGQPDTSGTGSVPKVWTQVDYSASGCQFNGYTQGPSYWGKTFMLWPPDPRTTTALSGSTLTTYLGLLGINSADQTTLSSIWSTWQGQGVGPGSTGLANLQAWLKGTAKGGASALPTFPSNYTPTSTTAVVSGVTSWNGSNVTPPNRPKTYYAVCRLFNRAYPSGSTWSASTLSTGTSFTADWRVRFFGTNDNTVLFNTTTGVMNLPSSTGYSINYNAILGWITASQDPFPTQMRAGRILYYSTIPTSITGTWPSWGGTDQRFWVEFIDHVLGFRQTASGVYADISSMAGYGADFTWGTIAINSPPAAPQYLNYINYADNPARPLLRFWFSPILMVDYLHNYNMYENTSNYFVMQPGDSYEAPIYTGKEAFYAALSTVESNHPNDYFTLAFYSQPRDSATSLNRFNCVASPLGPNYAYAKSALFFPFSTINTDGTNNGTEVTPYDADAATSQIPSANFNDTPRAKGGTCFAMGLMLCYNQFVSTATTDATLRSYVSSTPITFPTGMAGGMGRKGAQKIIIFETDGLANATANATLTASANGYNYYPIRYDMNKPYSSEYPTTLETTLNDTTVLNQVYTVVQQLASDFGSSRNPFKLYAIGFGPVFATGAPDASNAMSTLQTMQYYGGTQSDKTTALSSAQIITGTGSTMSANMISTYTAILQNGVQIALIK